MNKKNKINKAFTLIEILVVLAIIGIISTIGVLSFSNAKKQSRDAKRLYDIDSIRNALTVYFNIRNKYPIQSSVVLGGSNAKVLCVPADIDSDLGFFPDTSSCDPSMQPILTNVPKNITPGGSDYVYSSQDGKDYKILFSLEVGIAGLSSGNKCATSSEIKDSC